MNGSYVPFVVVRISIFDGRFVPLVVVNSQFSIGTGNGPLRTLKEGLFHIDRVACAYSSSAVGVIACIEDEVNIEKILSHLNQRDT